MFDQQIIKNGHYFMVKNKSWVDVLDNRDEKRVNFYRQKRVLFIRFGGIYALYSKHQKERSGVRAIDEETLLTYLKDQPYFIGLVKSFEFSDKRTSCYAISYDELNIVIDPTEQPLMEESEQNDATEKKFDDVPF